VKTSSKLYWLTFAAFQIVGLVLFALGDPHVHVVLKTAGWVLLLPGTLAGLAFAETIGAGVDIPISVVLGGVLLANFGAWYAARRIWLSVRSRVRTGKQKGPQKTGGLFVLGGEARLFARAGVAAGVAFAAGRTLWAAAAGGCFLLLFAGFLD